MFDKTRIAMIGEAGGKPIDRVDRLIRTPNSNALASELTAPPSNSATTERPATA